MNEQSKLEHDGFDAIPKDQKCIDRLEGLFLHFVDVQRQASQSLSILPLDNGPEITQFGPLTIVKVSADEPKFQGLSICPHCLTRAAMLLRDLATIVEELRDEAKKHRQSE